MDPINTPSVFIITSSVSQRPRRKKYCAASTPTDNKKPIPIEIRTVCFILPYRANGRLNPNGKNNSIFIYMVRYSSGSIWAFINVTNGTSETSLALSLRLFKIVNIRTRNKATIVPISAITLRAFGRNNSIATVHMTKIAIVSKYT